MRHFSYILVSWRIACLQKHASLSIFSGLSYALSHLFSIPGSLCSVHGKRRCLSQRRKCHSWSCSMLGAGTRPPTAVAPSVATYRFPFGTCCWSLGVIIHLLWDWPPLKINFPPADLGEHLALNWCISTKALDLKKLHFMRESSFAEKITIHAGQRCILSSYFPHSLEKIETSWKELDVFLWENHLGASCEQEEKAWDWGKCAAFLTSSVIRKTGFMLPPTSAIWCWCSLHISILLILFVLQALCSCPLLGVSLGKSQAEWKQS